MAEIPLMPPVPPSRVPEEPRLEDMTIEQLDRKIGELSRELDDLLRRNQGGRILETPISQKINERAKYIVRRQELLQKGSGGMI